MSKMALEGITIADFGWVWAAPHLGRLLADMGARVIKIESRKRMDHTRGLPPFPDRNPAAGPSSSGYHGWLNRNKLGVTLDLTQARGVELAKEIIKISDAMMENYSTGVMDKFGLGYEEVKKVRPDIIYVSLSPMGSNGPFSYLKMYGRPQVYMSSLAHITGHPDRPPHSTNISWGDPMAANHGALAMLAALRYRQRTGEGQFVELSQWEGLIGLVPEAIMDYTLNGRIRSRQGNRHEFMAPHNAYRCQGELAWVTIAVASDREWDALCEAMGRPAWTEDARFKDTHSRWVNQEELDQLLEEWTLEHTPEEVTRLLQARGVAAFPTLSNRALVEDEHLKARGFFETWDHPEAGTRTYDGVLWKMNKTPGRIQRRAPLIGEHNHYVFGELLGMPRAEIDRLIKEQVIY